MEKTKKVDTTVYGICTVINRTIRDIPEDEYCWNVTDTFKWHLSWAVENFYKFRSWYYSKNKNCNVGDKFETSNETFEILPDGYVHIKREYRHQYKSLPGSNLILDPLDGFYDLQEY